MEKVKVQLDVGAYMPTRAHEVDAGLDLYAREDVFLPMYDNRVFDTGVHVEIPKGYVGMIKSKSSLNVIIIVLVRVLSIAVTQAASV